MNQLLKSGSHPYPMVRGGGSFLILLGIGLLIGVATASNGVINLKPFLAGAIAGIISMPVVRRMWSLGVPRRPHIISVSVALALELALFASLSHFLGPDAALRDRWVWALIIVGVHFLPMYWAFGARIVGLGIVCTITAVSGLIWNELPFAVVGGIDALWKILFGIWFLLTPADSNPK